MAQRNEGHRATRYWFWLMAIVVAFVVIMAFPRDDATLGEAGGEVVPVAPIAEVGALQGLLRFTDFSQRPPDFGDVGRAHEYTRTGLNYLADAIVDVAADTGALRGPVAALRAGAQSLMGKSVVDHAEIVRVVFRQGAEAIATLQHHRAPWMSLEVRKLRQGADAIDPDQPLSQQGDEIKAYFTAASDILTRLGAEAPPRAGTTAADTG